MRELLENVFLVGLPLLMVWLWYDSMRAREVAVRICAQACQRYQVQLLDQTVALRKVGLKRNKRRGNVQLLRTYKFDFSIDGEDRRQGEAVVLGETPESVNLDISDIYTQEESEKVNEII